MTIEVTILEPEPDQPKVEPRSISPILTDVCQPQKNPEQPRIAFAASLAIPAAFEEGVEGLIEKYNGTVNIAAVIRQILLTERLGRDAFNELGALLKDKFGLEHTGHGFYQRPQELQVQAATSNHNSNLDSQIHEAIGKSPAPIWKPKQRGRYGKS